MLTSLFCPYRYFENEAFQFCEPLLRVTLTGPKDACADELQLHALCAVQVLFAELTPKPHAGLPLFN
jgi:hypothetical protein